MDNGVTVIGRYHYYLVQGEHSLEGTNLGKAVGTLWDACQIMEFTGPSLLQGTPTLDGLELEQFLLTLALFSVRPRHDERTGAAEAVLVFDGDATAFVFLKIGIVHGA